MGRVRALLFLFVALLVGLSPATALAHDGVSHHSQAEDSAASSFLNSYLSPVCPPGSGHVCGCGNLSLCESSAKATVAVRCSVSIVPPRVRDVVALQSAPAWPSPRFPPSLSRAPPQAS
jgi:hypothetical protein